MSSPSPCINDFSEASEMHSRIVDAAEKRFELFGFNKTTMAEIANDLDMSAANLYRFFLNKRTIAEACARRCIDARLLAMQDAIATITESAGKKLEALILCSLEVSYEELSSKPRINELVVVVTQESRELVAYKLSHEIALIKTILIEGHDRGEFCVVDPENTAEAVHNAILLFNVPLFMGLYSLDEFRRKAEYSCQLLLQGLLRR